ncbi:MAG: hypothetical protein V1797_16980 [Pseudomonadota bacterium]
MIVKMRKVTFIGLMAEKDEFLSRLQATGVTHLILPSDGAEPGEIIKELGRVGEVRRFLAKRAPKAPAPAAGGDYAALVARREELGEREGRLTSELLLLKKERAQLAVFGDFDPAVVALLRERGLKVNFYRASVKTMETLDLAAVHSLVTGTDKGETAFVTISLAEPGLALIPERLPARGLTATEELIAAKEAELAGIHAQYAELAQQIKVLEAAQAELTDRVAFARAALNVEPELDERLFVLYCWSAIPEADLVKQLGEDLSFHYIAEDPQEDDRVPVLLSNPSLFAPGEDLVQVYSHPNYSDFDPSGLVLYCFVIFYGMIIGDFGYGAVLGALTLWLKVKVKNPAPVVKRLVFMNGLLSISTMFFGVITGSYFGIILDPGNPLLGPVLMDFSTKEGMNQVMLISIIMGMVHLTMALAIKFKRTRDLPSLGWILVLWAGYFFLDAKMVTGTEAPIAQWILIAGLALVVLFTSKHKNPIIRVLAGLNGAMGAVQLFADVLSYMRLFALGLATMYMCQTFNMLGGMVRDSIPVVGYVFAALVLVLGHAINLGLGIMGGVVHGLRLNFLEWYRWCFEGDGLIFRPFRLTAKRQA